MMTPSAKVSRGAPMHSAGNHWENCLSGTQPKRGKHGGIHVQQPRHLPISTVFCVRVFRLRVLQFLVAY